jgi:hypothetical protein
MASVMARIAVAVAVLLAVAGTVALATGPEPPPRDVQRPVSSSDDGAEAPPSVVRDALKALRHFREHPSRDDADPTAGARPQPPEDRPADDCP